MNADNKVVQSFFVISSVFVDFEMKVMVIRPVYGHRGESPVPETLVDILLLGIGSFVFGLEFVKASLVEVNLSLSLVKKCLEVVNLDLERILDIGITIVVLVELILGFFEFLVPVSKITFVFLSFLLEIINNAFKSLSLLFREFYLGNTTFNSSDDSAKCTTKTYEICMFLVKDFCKIFNLLIYSIFLLNKFLYSCLGIVVVIVQSIQILLKCLGNFIDDIRIGKICLSNFYTVFKIQSSSIRAKQSFIYTKIQIRLQIWIFLTDILIHCFYSNIINKESILIFKSKITIFIIIYTQITIGCLRCGD